jgi:hypothetical protein
MDPYDVLASFFFCQRQGILASLNSPVTWVEDFVCLWLRKNSLGMNACLVGKGRVAFDTISKWLRSRHAKRDLPGNGVVERDIDLYCVCNKIFNVLELVQLVSRLDIVRALDDHPGQEAT